MKYTILNFGQAIEALKKGERVARQGWNGKGMWLIYSDGFIGNFREHQYHEVLTSTKTLPFIVMKTATNELVPWLASQTDVLAEDWVIVE